MRSGSAAVQAETAPWSRAPAAVRGTAAGNADRARPRDRRTDYDPATLHRNSRERETPMNAPLRTCPPLLTDLLSSAPAFASDAARGHVQTGRASWRERVGQNG